MATRKFTDLSEFTEKPYSMKRLEEVFAQDVKKETKLLNSKNFKKYLPQDMTPRQKELLELVCFQLSNYASNAAKKHLKELTEQMKLNEKLGLVEYIALHHYSQKELEAPEEFDQEEEFLSQLECYLQEVYDNL